MFEKQNQGRDDAGEGFDHVHVQPDKRLFSCRRTTTEALDRKMRNFTACVAKAFAPLRLQNVFLDLRH